MVADIKYCKYRLGWNTSYNNCHRGLSPFVVPDMSLYHQKERKAYQDRLGKLLTKIVVDIEKGEVGPNEDLGDYHGLLQSLPSYIWMLTNVVDS